MAILAALVVGICRASYPLAIDPDRGIAINRAESIGFLPPQKIRTQSRFLCNADSIYAEIKLGAPSEIDARPTDEIQSGRLSKP